MKKLDHLAKIYKFYDIFIIDLWGVMHNGIKLNESSINVVNNLYENNKKVIFLSNAPRPNKQVVQFLRKLKMDEKYLKNILTSGEAALVSLKNKSFGTKFFHLGPERDNSLFVGMEKNKTNIKDSEFILCTGLFDNYENDLEYYKNLLKDNFSKKMICTNPDLIVHRGNEKEYCAGTIAKIFESIGGKVVYFGKPYRAVYDTIIKKNEKGLVIGDNLNTDIKGANNLNIDSIFITSGIHRSEFNEERELNGLVDKYNVTTKYFQENLTW